MTVRTSFWLTRPSMLKALWTHVRVAVRLLREPRVRWWFKAVPLFAVVYVLSPLDVLPDVLPILGQLDDLGVLGLGVGTFVRITPGDIVEYHRAAIAQGRPYSPMPGAARRVIDAEFHRE